RRRHTRFSRDWSSDVCSSDLAHFLGAPTAPKVWQAADDVPVRDLVAPEVLQANPFLGSMNAGQFRAWAGTRGGMQEGRASADMRSEERRVGEGGGAQGDAAPH